MKKFKIYLEEVSGSVNHVLWDFGNKSGSAVLMVPADAFDKDQDKATLQTLKQRIPQARALTKLQKDRNPITHTSAKGTTKHYLVRVDFTTQNLKENNEINEIIKKLPDGKYRLYSHSGKNLGTFDSRGAAEKHEAEVNYFKQQENVNEAEGPPTAVQKTKDKQDREKEDLKRKHDREQETAREKDFRDKENKRKQDIAKREAEKRTRDSLKEYLEDGTDELVSTYKKDTPGQ